MSAFEVIDMAAVPPSSRLGPNKSPLRVAIEELPIGKALVVEITDLHMPNRVRTMMLRANVKIATRTRDNKLYIWKLEQ